MSHGKITPLKPAIYSGFVGVSFRALLFMLVAERLVINTRVFSGSRERHLSVAVLFFIGLYPLPRKDRKGTPVCALESLNEPARAIPGLEGLPCECLGKPGGPEDRDGIPVQVFTDAALLTQVPRADLVVVGADAIFQGYIANKVGTRALLLAAWTGGCKRLILADSSKFLAPPLARFFRVRQEPADEVWSRPAKSVRVLNPYFELVELELAGNLVTEQGTFTPKRLNKLIRQRPVSRALVTGLKPAVSAFPSALCREGMK